MVEYRFVLVVLVILVQNLIYVIYASSGLPGDDLAGIFTGSLMMIFCVLAISKDRRSLRIGLTWGVLSMVTAPFIILVNAWPLSVIYLSFIFYTPARIAIYPAIWALCVQNQGQVAGYAPCDTVRPCWMERRAPEGF